MSIDHGGGASRIGRRNLRRKEEVFRLKMLTELGLGMGFAQVSAAVLRQHSDATRAWQPLLQFEDEAYSPPLKYSLIHFVYCFAVLLHQRLGVREAGQDQLHFKGQTSLQASAGLHQQIRRQQHHKSSVT